MPPEPSFNTWTILFLIAAAQGLFLSALIAIHNKGSITANRIMAIFTGIFSMVLCYYVLFWTGYSCNYMWTKGWCSAMPFLFGPLMYFYLNLIKNGSLPKNFRWHLIPFAVHFTYMLPFIYWFTSGPDAISQSRNPVNVFLQTAIFRHISEVTFSFQLFNALQFLSMIIYAAVLIRFAVRLKINQVNSSNWYLKNAIFYALFAILFSGYWITLWIGILPDGLDYIISAFMVLCIYLIGYTAFRQPVKLFEKNNPRRKGNQHNTFIKQQTSKLVDLLETKKPWLDNELNLQKLAEIANLSPHELSFIINTELNKNFADLIHEYRIKEACRLLSEDSESDLKILAIAFDVGYSNKATFNAAFKKLTGMSPSAYKEASRSAALKGMLNQAN